MSVLLSSLCCCDDKGGDDTAACCVPPEFTSCVNLTEELCNQIGGQFHVDDNCSDFQCEPLPDCGSVDCSSCPATLAVNWHWVQTYGGAQCSCQLDITGAGTTNKLGALCQYGGQDSFGEFERIDTCGETTTGTTGIFIGCSIIGDPPCLTGPKVPRWNMTMTVYGLFAAPSGAADPCGRGAYQPRFFTEGACCNGNCDNCGGDAFVS